MGLNGNSGQGRDFEELDEVDGEVKENCGHPREINGMDMGESNPTRKCTAQVDGNAVLATSSSWNGGIARRVFEGNN